MEIMQQTSNERGPVVVRHVPRTDEELPEHPMASITIQLVVQQIDDQVAYSSTDHFGAVQP